MYAVVTVYLVLPRRLSLGTKVMVLPETLVVPATSIPEWVNFIVDSGDITSSNVTAICAVKSTFVVAWAGETFTSLGA